MDFVNNIINTIIKYDDSKNKYDVSLQLIIIEYIYSKCYDCKVLLKEKNYKCDTCDIIRCKFHHFVNALDYICVICQYNNESCSSFKHMYKCINCDSLAYYGYISNIILCETCVNQYKNEYPSLIYFGPVCSKNCIGAGWFKDKQTKILYCMLHKNKNCDYNYIES
jgi:hypothetical protein